MTVTFVTFSEAIRNRVTYTEAQLCAFSVPGAEAFWERRLLCSGLAVTPGHSGNSCTVAG